MTRLLSRQWIIVIFVVCTLVALSACKSGDAVTAPADTAASNHPTVAANASPLAATPTSRPPGATQAGATPSSTAATSSVDMTFGPGTLTFPDTKAGLVNVASYQAALTLSFVGTLNGQAQKWSKTYVMLAAKQPAARQLTLVNTGDLSNLDPVFMAEADGTSYERRGKNACGATVIDPANSLAARMEPAGFLTGVIGAVEAGSETVNDVAAHHYTFDERAFGQVGVAKSTGELWVASDGGYIVRYKVATVGNADYFGKGIQGTLNWDYELTGVNQPVAIELPKDCPSGMMDAPLLLDATEVVRLPGVLSYSTVTRVGQAAAFYQKQIPLLGGKFLGNPTSTDTLVLLDYTQGTKTLTVVIRAGQGGTTVRIVEGAGQH